MRTCKNDVLAVLFQEDRWKQKINIGWNFKNHNLCCLLPDSNITVAWLPLAFAIINLCKLKPLNFAIQSPPGPQTHSLPICGQNE